MAHKIIHDVAIARKVILANRMVCYFLEFFFSQYYLVIKVKPVIEIKQNINRKIDRRSVYMLFTISNTHIHI